MRNSEKVSVWMSEVVSQGGRERRRVMLERKKGMKSARVEGGRKEGRKGRSSVKGEEVYVCVCERRDNSHLIS